MARDALCAIPFTPEQRAAAVERRRDGEDPRDIAASLGCSVRIVYRWCAAAGLPRRSSGRPGNPEVTTDQAIAAWREHGTAPKAALALGMGKSAFERRANSVVYVP